MCVNSMSRNFDNIEVRPFSSQDEYERMLDHFYLGGETFQRGMGIDPARMPPREEWLHAVLEDHERPDEKKTRVWLAWYCDGEAVGHSSVNCIRIGQDAFVHLHLWKSDRRRAGLGTEFVRRSVNYFFERLRLALIYSEPYAENPAPNRVFQKLGFTLAKRYRTTPGVICFEQEVNRWELQRNSRQAQ